MTKWQSGCILCHKRVDYEYYCWPPGAKSWEVHYRLKEVYNGISVDIGSSVFTFVCNGCSRDKPEGFNYKGFLKMRGKLRKQIKKTLINNELMKEFDFVR